MPSVRTESTSVEPVLFTKLKFCCTFAVKVVKKCLIFSHQVWVEFCCEMPDVVDTISKNKAQVRHLFIHTSLHKIVTILSLNDLATLITRDHFSRIKKAWNFSKPFNCMILIQKALTPS